MNFYIDLDIDEATLKVVSDIDYDLFSFKTITVEHDYYKVDEPGSDVEFYRSECRRIFSDAGYELVCADVGNNCGPQDVSQRGFIGNILIESFGVTCFNN